MPSHLEQMFFLSTYKVEERIFKKHISRDITVFRIENKDGEGPFKNLNNVHKNLGIFKMNKLLAMRPDQDFDETCLRWSGFWFREKLKDYRFGFASIKQMYKWVNQKQVDELRKNGYNIKRYKVKFALVSENQCIFDINDIVM